MPVIHDPATGQFARGGAGHAAASSVDKPRKTYGRAAAVLKAAQGGSAGGGAEYKAAR